MENKRLVNEILGITANGKSAIQLMVEEFHLKKGHKVDQYLNKKDVLFRLRLMLEELAELTKSADLRDPIEFIDALGDLEYVVNGTAVTFGIPLQAVVEEIHKSNMSKGENFEGKPVKGEEFHPPDIKRVLKDYYSKSYLWSITKD